MVDLIVGIIVCIFLALGVWEGLIKSLGSVVLIFVALFLASMALEFLAKGNPQFADPSYLGTIITFLVVWALSYFILDLILTLLLKKVVKVIVLGHVDKIGGILVGGLKGFLICGVILQLMFYMPVSANTKKALKDSLLARFSVSIYLRSYPYAKKFFPKASRFMQKRIFGKETEKEKELFAVPEKMMAPVKKYEDVSKKQHDKLLKLIKEQKLVPSVPQTRVKKK